MIDPKTLKQLRKKLGYSQEEAARQQEVSLYTYQKWEQGATNVSKGRWFGIKNMFKELKKKEVK